MTLQVPRQKMGGSGLTTFLFVPSLSHASVRLLTLSLLISHPKEKWPLERILIEQIGLFVSVMLATQCAFIQRRKQKENESTQLMAF